MNLGLRFHDTAPLPFEERVANISNSGFGCVQVALPLAFKSFPGISALTPGFAMYLKNIFAKNNVDIAVLGCYLNLLHPDPAELLKIQNTYRANIQFASFLGCGVVGTETGCPNPEYRHVPECRNEENFKQFVKNLLPLVEDAEHFGITLGIEPVWAHSVYSVKRARQMLNTIASPNVKIILDVVNLLNIENAGNADEILKEALDILGDNIYVLHLKDFILDEQGFRNNVPAGFGQMNYTPLADFCAKFKPFIHATLEDTKPENAVESLNRMKAVMGNETLR